MKSCHSERTSWVRNLGFLYCATNAVDKQQVPFSPRATRRNKKYELTSTKWELFSHIGNPLCLTENHDTA